LGYISDSWKVKYLALETGSFALKSRNTKKDSAYINMFLSESKFRDSAIKNLLRTNIFNDIYKIENSLYTLTFAPDNFMLWEPDNNIRRSVESAMQILNGSLNSMSLGILYTSELNNICKIAPWNWNQEIKLITKNLSNYDPLYLNMEEALTLMKNNENAKLLLSVYDPANNSMNTYLKGHTDGPVNLYLFTEEDGEIYSKRINVPPFEEQKEFSFLIDSH